MAAKKANISWLLNFKNHSFLKSTVKESIYLINKHYHSFIALSFYLQQPGIPQQQLPYMMLGNSHQQQQQSHQASSQQPYAAYIMQQQGGMKAGSMSQAQPYYGNMSMSGRQVMGQTSLPTQGQQMGGQIQKPSPDYTSFQQQQQMQHRYPQVQYETSVLVL